ncbi:MarR family transcriptional regulator [uncultured Roseibium sp.]|uniref:MarR family winged helix-turn-helix transcriptional regulator n=1 Tax=uncultured Roseibium sp. TaxID=1936171 RepID=UPI0025933F4D|nr:MarR family transcriptional regulator [uncultured Roseibium sp.]
MRTPMVKEAEVGQKSAASSSENGTIGDRAAVARDQWNREIPGLDLAPMVLLGRLNEASHVVSTEHLAPIFKAAGLKQGEFDVLATLVRSGPPYKLMPTELYRSTMMSSGGMTARLDRLEKSGHITRCPHPEDRRALMVCLTDQGLKLIKGMMPDYIACQQKTVSGLTDAEVEQLSALLEKFIASTAR